MRMPTTGAVIAGIIGLRLIIGPVSAQQPPLPTFVDGQVLIAAQLNALVDRINSLQTELAAAQAVLGTKANQSDLSALQTTLASKAAQSDLTSRQTTLASKAAQSDLTSRQTTLSTAQPVLDLAPSVQVLDATHPLNGLAGPHVLFTGVNVHIRSGSGATDDGVPLGSGGTLTNLGNLIIGYNEAPGAVSRIGSHNLIVGSYHNYSNYGGFVAGYGNNIAGPYSSVSGGESNTATGEKSSVSGGHSLDAPEPYSWTTGGLVEESAL